MITDPFKKEKEIKTIEELIQDTFSKEPKDYYGKQNPPQDTAEGGSTNK